MTSEQTRTPEREADKQSVARRRLPHWGRPEPLRGIRRWLRVLGPGLITGAADDDPSGIGTYSQAGAAFGVGLLWLALYLLPLVIAVQEMCGRIGLVTGRGIAGVIRRHYSRKILFGAVLLLFIANTINVGADLGAMAASVQLLAPDLPFRWLLVGFALGTLLLEIFIPYRYYARVLKLLTLSLLAYVVTGIVVRPDWLALLRATVVPQISFTPAYLALVIAVIGTTISPYLFFWQASEEVEETELRHPNLKKNDPALRSHVKRWIRALRVDTAWGLLAASATFWFIVVVTGVTLHAHGNVTKHRDGRQAAQALQPLAGDFAGVALRARHHRHWTAGGAGACWVGGLWHRRGVWLARGPLGDAEPCSWLLHGDRRVDACWPRRSTFWASILSRHWSTRPSSTASSRCHCWS